MDGTDFFGPWEGDAITSWVGATSAIEDVLNKIGRRRMVWRGQVNAKWCLHSGLYRRILATGSGPSPKESDLVKAEDRLLTIAREWWRHDQLPYLELVAHMQHYRAPTRLLDVSLNPLVALWFAVEQQHSDEDHQDGRLFAIDVTDRTVRLDSEWSTYDIPWRGYPKDSKWSLELPLLWKPPSYNDRIPAQQSGFLLAGVPKYYKGSNAQYRKGPGDGSSAGLWSANEVRRATSVPTRMVDRSRNLHSNSRPTLTLRITSDAKDEIRRRLERDYGINSGTMYPDLFGMATEIRGLVDHGGLLKRPPAAP
ncbi:FRG domain-containing protein [Kocuria salsicia]|uniref:FRG domain-containing protein n=1 Tax=Kocuria salsicia TaxID=664639 RepID=UPI0016437717|nr:FRG domain-containing protein [Kocuria salsicia]